MNAFRTIGAFTRRLSILLAITILMSLFLYLYYFRYVPSNRERLQHQAFLILQQQQEGIRQHLEDLTNYMAVQNRQSVDNGSARIGGSLKFDHPLAYTVNFEKDKKIADSKHGSGDPKVSWDLDGDRVVTFKFRNHDTTLSSYKVSLNELFKKILESGNIDFFRYHFIICNTHAGQPAEFNEEQNSHSHVPDSSHILYNSPGLPVSERLETDSMGSLLKSVQFSKIVDLEISGSQYKGFLLPFQLEHHTLILAGLMTDTEYDERLQRIPFGSVSCIAIIFILILICLPYIKVFFMGREEHWGTRDVAFLGLTLFVGTAILLVILQQLLMQTGGQLRTKDKLYKLSDRINAELHKEISLAYFELKHLDTALRGAIERDTSETADKNAVDNSLIREDHFKKLLVKSRRRIHDYYLTLPDSNNYLNYDRAQWFSDSGKQVYKGAFDTIYTFPSVRRRQYFKDIKEKRLYSFEDSGIVSHGGKVNSFTIQPVYSMSTNAFEVNVVTPSEVTGVIGAGISTYMNSVVNTVTPKGYQFYIIDDKGLIQFQSEGTVTLKENFLEWINDDQNLASIIRNRQSKYVPNQYINDRQCSMYIRPLDQLPMHLVVYHCNDNSTASMLHVNAFVLFFMLILFITLFVYGIIAFNKHVHFSRLNQPIAQLGAIRWHGKNKEEFLFASNRYLLLYVLATVIFKTISQQYAASWLIGLVFPIFVIWTLTLCLRQHMHGENPFPSFISTRKDRPGFLNQPHNYTALIFLFFLNFIFFKIETEHVSWLALAGYEMISLAFMPLALSKHPVNNISGWQKIFFLQDKQLRGSFWFLLVIAISIVPVNCFFSYAQEKEIALQTKADQLDIAENIERRLSTFGWADEVAKKRIFPETVFFDRGIYADGCIKTYPSRLNNDGKVYTEPYDTIIRSISWKYHSVDKILPGQDFANDEQWFLRSSAGLMTLSYNLRPESVKPESIRNVQALKLTYKLPSIFGYYLMNNFVATFLIIFFSALLLFLFYGLLSTIAGRMFQTWNLKKQDYSLHNSDHSFIHQRLHKKTYDEMNGDYLLVKEVFKKYRAKEDTKSSCLAKAWELEYSDVSDDNERLAQEGLILFNQYHLAPLYEKLWTDCSDEEKYLLYDMSRDGFMNSKKVNVIQLLLYKGLLINQDEELRIMSVSFRNFILDKKNSPELLTLIQKFRFQGTWSKLRTPVLVIITAIGAFLFITQQDLLQRMTTLVPTLSAVLGLGTLLLGSRSPAVNKK
jgi:heme/copper-type cytochrome/quinol oxidase subunit 2